MTKNKKIILLEDEATLGTLYSKKLTDAGYTVKHFVDVDSLMKECDKFKADAAFLDQTLSGSKDGTAVIPAIKKANKDAKVAMLSNYSEFQMEEAAKKAGADDYLLKINTSPAKLVEYVNKLFS